LLLVGILDLYQYDRRPAMFNMNEKAIGRKVMLEFL
jgi:hypothetical protein|tara:strand:- start:1778 stop:1885 length:108 start_codon:yes stop_codon:yes gene_type:complete